MSFRARVRDVSRFWHAQPADKLRWGRALAAVAAVRVGLRVWSLPRLASAIGLSLGEEARGLSICELPEALAAARSVRGVLRRWPSRSECLVGALAAGYLLREHRPHLLIGVRGRAPQIAAHAWLELDGARLVINEAGASLEFVAMRRARAA